MISWSDEEYAQSPTVSVGDSAQQVVDSLEASPEQEDPKEEFSEVRKRVSKIQYYMSISDYEFFEGDTSEEAQEVRNEFNAFINRQLKEYLGMESPAPVIQVKLQFSPEEEFALKALAAKVMRKPALVEQDQPTAPVANPTIKPAAKAPAPVVSAPTVQAKKKTVVAKPAQAKKTQKQPVADPTLIHENGKVYRMVTVNDKQVKMDVTKQARPSGLVQPLPTPSKAQATSISETQARVESATLPTVTQLVVDTVIRKANEE